MRNSAKILRLLMVFSTIGVYLALATSGNAAPSPTVQTAAGTNTVFKSFDWIQKRAREGDPKAQVALGRMYKDGVQVRRFYFEAGRWFLRAAKSGDKWGQYEAGLYYQKEIGDRQKAAFWYQKAANQGVAEAQTQLEKLNSPFIAELGYARPTSVEQAVADQREGKPAVPVPLEAPVPPATPESPSDKRLASLSNS